MSANPGHRFSVLMVATAVGLISTTGWPIIATAFLARYLLAGLLGTNVSYVVALFMFVGLVVVAFLALVAFVRTSGLLASSRPASDDAAAGPPAGPSIAAP